MIITTEGRARGPGGDDSESESALSVRYEPGNIMMMHTKPTGSLQVHAAAGRAPALLRVHVQQSSTRTCTSPVLQNEQLHYGARFEQLHYGATLHHIRV
jgi:hypothetical protein